MSTISDSPIDPVRPPLSAESERSVVADPMERYRAEVDDARLLLEFAVSEGRPLEDRLVDAIKAAEDAARPSPPGTSPATVPSDSRSAFEKAYRDLAKALAPITAATLRATSDSYGRTSLPFALRTPTSEAKIWSRKLWLIAIVVTAIAIFGENLDRILHAFFPLDEDDRSKLLGIALLKWHIFSNIVQFCVPFTYGALGAVAYLLRACHEHIYKRQFDVNHIPEYYNRILLGLVSGGAIVLFISQVTTDDGVTQISAQALGFLAGYNTDLLFSTVERVSTAILPKVGLDSVRREERRTASVTTAVDVSLQQLLDRYKEATTPEDKALIKSLIDRLRDKM